jgi:hypothetical protein
VLFGRPGQQRTEDTDCADNDDEEEEFHGETVVPRVGGGNHRRPTERLAPAPERSVR